jgi:hypothetical protein
MYRILGWGGAGLTPVVNTTIAITAPWSRIERSVERLGEPVMVYTFRPACAGESPMLMPVFRIGCPANGVAAQNHCAERATQGMSADVYRALDLCVNRLY